MNHKEREAMQAALEFVTNPLWGDGAYMDSDVYQDARELAKLLRAALAEPEQDAEPVAWMDDFGNAFPLAANKGAGGWFRYHFFARAIEAALKEKNHD